MISRKYTKLIEFHKTTTVADGFGGNTVTTELDFTCWANVTTKNAIRITENGQNDNFVQTTFIIRNRYNLNVSIKDNYIVYNGLTYNIDNILNEDLNNIDIVIQSSQRE